MKHSLMRNPSVWRTTLLCVPIALSAFIGTIANAGLMDNVNGQVGALAPENLSKKRPAPPFDLTGTWTIDGEFRFIPRPVLKPEAAKAVKLKDDYEAKGLAYNNPTAQCWPPGVPEVMKLIWSTHWIQLPTSIVMISNYENNVRWVFMDGRKHTDPDLYSLSYSGESIGHWEGDALVIETRNFEARHHNIEDVPVSEQLRITERVQLLDKGAKMRITYTMTDPVNWEGEWVNVKNYKREHHTDFAEMHCLPDSNAGMSGTADKYNVARPE